ncbi:MULTISPECIES: carboxypeptidase-like regulatory domain-containing protein [Hymenobacter]|uniref:carboxypeptidase-like regulatory domain-containing protein n=1 Tax=Hymenobacter TaxID=89966 RepID=UPI00140464DD|nr:MULTISPECIES: carboxypeptidase-like regulatory domain-containing protein [Hymenobacter]QIL75546.1 carboxypeptidase-like regulatory domain-containing protein [Hymenobacter sp. HDW8]
MKTNRLLPLNTLLIFLAFLRVRLLGGKLAARFGVVILLVGGLSHGAYAQYPVRGIIRDKETKEPLPFVGIGVKGTTMGTASNENGEFTLSLPSVPQTLIFSELAHIKDTVRVTQAGQSLEIELAPATVVLSEVKVASYAYQLVDRAYQQMKKNYGRKFYGKAYYRQITRIDNDPTELLEMVWNAKSNIARIEGTSIAQGRYAAKQALISDKNFSLYTKAFGLYDDKADTTKALGLFSPNVVANYLLEIKGVLEKGETGGVAEIAFETRPEQTKYRSKGTVWIDVDTYQVIRYKMTTPQLTRKANNPTFSFKNTELELDMVFQNDTTAVNPLEHIKADMTYDLVRPGLPPSKMKVSAFTFFYDTSRKPTNLTYNKVTSNERDLETIRKVKYDPEFWANNPVVKRTPLEDEVAKSFEQKGAFGTMVKKPEPKADVRIRNGRIE